MSGLLKRLKTIMFIAFAFLPSTAFGYDVYIPHISGTGGFWQDTLHVNNNQLAEASFAVTLFDGGTEAYHGSFSINGLGSLRIDLKSLVPDIAEGTGIVNYDSEHLYFRLSHESKSGGGAAEFRLTGDRHPVLGFYFSDYTPEVAWKAIAVANMNSFGVYVKLYAVTKNGDMHFEEISIAPFSKAVGIHSKWFPFLPLENISKIIAVSPLGLNGVTISGNAGESFLLFTAATYIPISDPEQSLVHIGLDAPVQISALDRIEYIDGLAYFGFKELIWKEVTGASYYIIEIDCNHCCHRGFSDWSCEKQEVDIIRSIKCEEQSISNIQYICENHEEWLNNNFGRPFKIVTYIKGTHFLTPILSGFGARWRVYAVDEMGKKGNKSLWQIIFE